MKKKSLAVGCSYFGVADPGDGVPGTAYTKIEIIEEGSVVFNFNDPNTVNFRAEGMDEPWAVYDKAGDPDSIEVNIPSPSVDEMILFCGGTKEGDKWIAPVTRPNLRKTVKLQTLPYDGKYTEYVFANCKILGKLNQAPNSEQSDILLVRATKLAAITADGKQMAPYTREVKEVEVAGG